MTTLLVRGADQDDIECTTSCAADGLELDLNDISTGDEVIDPSIGFPVANGGYTHPVALTPGHANRFTIELFNCRMAPSPGGSSCPATFPSTTQGDGFAVRDEFASQTERVFAVPEPADTRLFWALSAAFLGTRARTRLRRQ